MEKSSWFHQNSFSKLLTLQLFPKKFFHFGICTHIFRFFLDNDDAWLVANIFVCKNFANNSSNEILFPLTEFCNIDFPSKQNFVNWGLNDCEKSFFFHWIQFNIFKCNKMTTNSINILRMQFKMTELFFIFSFSFLLLLLYLYWK